MNSARIALAAAVFAAALLATPAHAGRQRVYGWARARPGFQPRPSFSPYYHPYYTHEYWLFLYGVPVPAVRSAAPERERLRLGLGAFGGAIDVERGEAALDLGLLARLGLSRHLQLEAEVSRTETDDRLDHRVGGALLVQLLPTRALSPYILGGGGFNRAELEDGDFSADQAYGELGVGIELSLGRHIGLFGDVRAGMRKGDASDRASDRETNLLVRDGGAAIDDDERFVRGRVGALLYF